MERYKWTVPAGIAKGTLAIQGALKYRRLPQSVADLVEIGKVPILPVAEDQAVISTQ